MPLIPAERLTDWTPGVYTGVPGGIPERPFRQGIDINVTESPYNADNTGVSNAGTAIQNAINDAGDAVNPLGPDEYRVVLLPAGTYRMTSNLQFVPYRDKITLRGAGMGITTLVMEGGSQISTASGGGFPGTTVTAGISRGSTELTVADMTYMQAGQLIQFGVENDYSIPVYAMFGYDLANYGVTVRKQITRVTAVNVPESKITIFPPLYDDYGSGSLANKIYPLTNSSAPIQSLVEKVGIEDMTIDVGGVGGGVFALNFTSPNWGCWWKNIEAHDSLSHMNKVGYALNIEIRGCYFHDQGSGSPNGSILLYETSAGGLIEDNAFVNGFPHIETNGSASGNVFGYNLSKGTVAGEGLSANHAAHNSYNLWEGNVLINSAGIKSDGYHGSASRDTIARNYICGYVYQMAFTREYSSVGNVIEFEHSYGLPNTGNPFFSGYASLIGTLRPDNQLPADPWPNWGLRNLQPGTVSFSGTVATATNPVFTQLLVDQGAWVSGIVAPEVGPFVGTQMTTFYDSTHVGITDVGTYNNLPFKIVPGQANSTIFEQLDLDVEATAIDKGNWSVLNQSYSPLGGDTIPISFYRSTKPSFFGSISWPFFDAATFHPTEFSHENPPLNPAAYRYFNQQPPPPGDTVSDPTAAPSGGTYEGNQVITMSCPTSGATIRYTTDGSTPSPVYGTIYSSPVGLTVGVTTIKMIAYKAGMNDSAVVTEIYNIEESDGGGGTLDAVIARATRVILGD